MMAANHFLAWVRMYPGLVHQLSMEYPHLLTQIHTHTYTTTTDLSSCYRVEDMYMLPRETNEPECNAHTGSQK